MLLRTDKKEAQRHRARETLREYLGEAAPAGKLLKGVLAQIQAHDVPKGAPRLEPVATPSNSRSVYEVTILGRLFRVTYDNKHKELENIQLLAE